MTYKDLVIAVGLMAAPLTFAANDFEQQMQQQVAPFWSQQQIQFLALPDGHQIPYLSVQTPGAKATVVVVNGRTESLLKYQQLAYELSQQGYSVLLFDHRGQGLSQRYTEDRFKGHIDQFQTYVTDMHQLLSQVGAELTKPLLVLGHSMGGAITTSYLEQYPDTFAAAVLSAPMLGIQGKLVFSENDACMVSNLVSVFSSEGYAGFSDAPYQPAPFVGNALTGSELHYQWTQQLYQQYPQIQLGGPTWGWLAQSCAQFPLLLQNANKLQLPVVVLQAELDSIVSNQAQQQFCQVLADNPVSGCVGGAVVQVKGARHELLFEQDAIRGFALSRLLQHFASAVDSLEAQQPAAAKPTPN